MYTESETSEKAFHQLKQYKNRICFVPYESEWEESYTLRINEGEAFWESVLRNAAYARNQYDVIGMLLGVEKKRRIAD